MSIAEIGAELGKSSQTVHYHVNALVKVGLLMAVDDRKKHARKEKLYVRNSLYAYDMGPSGSREYHAFQAKSFGALMRSATRDVELGLDLVTDQPEVYEYLVMRRKLLRASKMQIETLKKKIFDLFTEVLEEDDGEPKIQIQSVAMIYPTQGQIRRWKNEYEVED